ncbi:MAG: SMI1/KNR4 family protein [Planctomycetota bacterium]
MIDDLIVRMDKWLRNNRSDYYGSLLPGATDVAFAEFESKFSLRLPNEFRSFYRWRNGQPASELASFQDNLMFTPLNDVAEIKDTLDGMIGNDFEDPEWWRRGWVPFLASGSGDHLCIDLVAEDGGTPGQLISFWHDDEERDVEFPSLADWLSDLVQSMEDGTLELA